MPNKSEQVARELRRLNHQLRHLSEQAEGKAHEVNLELKKLASTGLLRDLVILGPIIRNSATFDPNDSSGGQGGQAALLGSGGIGVALWDLQDFLDARNTERLEADAFVHFIPFDQCDATTKASLFFCIDTMLGLLLRELQLRALID